MRNQHGSRLGPAKISHTAWDSSMAAIVPWTIDCTDGDIAYPMRSPDLSMHVRFLPVATSRQMCTNKKPRTLKELKAATWNQTVLINEKLLGRVE